MISKKSFFFCHNILIFYINKSKKMLLQKVILKGSDYMFDKLKKDLYLKKANIIFRNGILNKEIDENIDMQLQKIKMSKCIKMKKNRKKSRFIEEKPRINTKKTYTF